MALSVDAYGRALQQLLPRGAVWNLESGSQLSRLLLGMAEELARVDARGDTLVLEEMDPRTSLELLTDWERVLGLPDGCLLMLPEAISERQVLAGQKAVALGGQTPQFYVDLASTLGYTVTVDEYRPLRAGFHAGDRVLGPEWAYSFLVNVLVGARPYDIAVLAAHPLAYWRLDEPSGAVARDSSGHERDLSIVSGVTLGVPGLLADSTTAFEFDGVAGYLQLAYASWMDPVAAAFTLECIIEADAFTGTWRSLFYFGTEIIVALQDGGNNLFVQVARGMSTYSKFVSLPSLVTGDRAHLHVTWDSRYVRVYLDAALLDTLDTGSSAPLNVPGGTFYVGRRFSGGPGEIFDGVLDEVSLYGYTMAIDVIADHVAAALSSASVVSGTYFHAGSRAGETLLGYGSLDVECILSRQAPAHTLPLFAYPYQA